MHSQKNAKFKFLDWLFESKLIIAGIGDQFSYAVDGWSAENMFKSISISFVSMLYATIISILAVPIYLHFLGPDRYGLVGIFLLLLPVISLLDLGFGVTAMRESAAVDGNATRIGNYRNLMQGLEFIFLAIFLLFMVSSVLFSNLFVTRWLKVDSALHSEAILASAFMFATLSARWLSILYRSCVNGFEAIGWLAGFNVIIATLRFIGVIPFLAFGINSLDFFFGYQLAVSLIEILGFYIKAKRLMPDIEVRGTIKQSLAAVNSVMRFTITVSVGGIIWVGATQIDKVWLMGHLNLEEYGQYSLAVLLASGVSILSIPVNIVMTPRLCNLYSIGDEQEFLKVYKRCTQYVTILASAAVAVIWFFPLQILLLWTQLPSLPSEIGIVFKLYAVGNGMLALSIFMHYLQISVAKLRLYVVGVLLFCMTFVFLLAALMPEKGATGAAIAWTIVNALYLLVWTPFIHNRLMPSLGWRWLMEDIGLITAASFTSVFFLSFIQPTDKNWLEAIFSLAIVGFVALCSALLASSEARNHARSYLPTLIQKLR